VVDFKYLCLITYQLFVRPKPHSLLQNGQPNNINEFFVFIVISKLDLLILDYSTRFNLFVEYVNILNNVLTFILGQTCCT
jgi:hypothetical protein